MRVYVLNLDLEFQNLFKKKNYYFISSGWQKCAGGLHPTGLQLLQNETVGQSGGEQVRRNPRVRLL